MRTCRQDVMRWLGMVLLVAGGTASGTAPAGAAPAKVTMAWVAVSGAQAVAWVAAEGGHFKQNGLDVDLEFWRASATWASPTRRRGW